VSQHLWGGLAAVVGSESGIAYLVAGTLIGVIMGVIPGIGGAVILSVILSFVLHIDITATLCLFLGTYAGSYFSASMTSILLNTPAHPEAFAVTLDGFPMARRGEAGRALGLSATATCIGGLIGCAVLLGFLQIINYLPNLFHPPEYVALIFLAILLVGTMGADSVSKALISMGLGLAVASVGSSVVTGTFRFTFNNTNLYAGFSLVSLLLGLFAIPQMVLVFGTKTAVASQDMTGRTVGSQEAVQLERGFGRQAIYGVAEAFKHWRYLILGGLIGSVGGIVPGIGGFAANFMSYGTAKQVSKNQHRFGTGIPEGIIAPEASSLSKEAGGMVPILGLGIPGSVGGALLLAALTIKGLRTGYGFSQAYPTLPYEMMWIILLGGIIGTAIGLAAVPVLARITHIPGPVLVLFIFSFAVLGSYVADVSYFACLEVLVFGVIGFVLRRLRYSLASFVLGLVLGPTLDANLHLTTTIYPGFSWIVHRPLADAIFLLVILLLLAQVRQGRRSGAKLAPPAAAVLAEASVEDDGPVPVSEDDAEAEPSFLLLAAITTLVLFVGSVWYVIYDVSQYDTTTALMPAVGGLLVAIPSGIRLPMDIRAAWRARSGEPPGSPASPVPLTGPALVAEPALAGRANLGAPGPATVTEAVASGAAVPRQGPRWKLIYRRELVAFIWLGALLIACDLVGFAWAVAGFAIIYGLTCTREYFRSWVWCGIFSVLSAALLYMAATELFSFAHITFQAKFGG
jgi:putative tricarboxylic transport membrane protein